MKTGLKFGAALLGLLVCVLTFGSAAQAKSEETIKQGIYAEHIDLSGMTREQACLAVESFVSGLKSVPITLQLGGGTKVNVTVEDLGIIWANPELVDEALGVGTEGNVIQRYKAMKDLEQKSLVYPIDISFDLQTISNFLTNTCTKYDTERVDWTLSRVNNEFEAVEGRNGYALDVERSIDRINDYLTDDWDYQPCTIVLDVDVILPRGSLEELMQVKDVLGSFSTSYASSNADRKANIANGCRLVDGITLYPGDEFSTYKLVAPFTAQNGYYMAGSYLEGRVVDSMGGGICQVSTTLYNAVLRAELGITMRYNHSMTVAYVDISADAVIAESAGKDFRFVNNLEHPVYIEGRTENNRVIFTIYGVETRPSNREVCFETEILETIHVPDQITVDDTQPVGYIAVTGGHTGYKARLWKVVLEDGREVSRTQVNNSNYNMSPRSATVGTATSDPHVYNEIMAAVNTNSIDNVKDVIALLTAPQVSDEGDEDE